MERAKDETGMVVFMIRNSGVASQAYGRNLVTIICCVGRIIFSSRTLGSILEEVPFYSRRIDSIITRRPSEKSESLSLQSHLIGDVTAVYEREKKLLWWIHFDGPSLVGDKFSARDVIVCQPWLFSTSLTVLTLTGLGDGASVIRSGKTFQSFVRYIQYLV